MPLPWLVPPRVALELLLTGDPIDAARACEVGLVNRVVPGDRLHEAVQALAESIAANAPLSVRAAKEMVYRAAVGRSEDEFVIADAIWEPVYRSEDAQEGPRAFGERRPPEWKGR
jgi:enoyl-CoA hydratase/carnithine racemase